MDLQVLGKTPSQGLGTAEQLPRKLLKPFSFHSEFALLILVLHSRSPYTLN